MESQSSLPNVVPSSQSPPHPHSPSPSQSPNHSHSLIPSPDSQPPQTPHYHHNHHTLPPLPSATPTHTPTPQTPPTTTVTPTTPPKTLRPKRRLAYSNQPNPNPSSSSRTRSSLPSSPPPGLADKQLLDADFLIAQQEYASTLDLLLADDNLVKLRAEYDKMHRAILRSRQHSDTLYAQQLDLHNEYTANLASTEIAHRSSAQDQETLKNLRLQIRRAADMVESSAKREEAFKEDLRQLRQDVANLHATVKQGVGLSVIQERTLSELLQAKEQSAKELEEELDKITHLRAAISDSSDKIRVADTDKRRLEKEILEFKEQNLQKKAEIDAELRNKDRLEREVKDLRAVVTAKTQEVKARQDTVNRATEDITTLESQIRAQRMSLAKTLSDQELLGARTIKLQQECDEQLVLATQLLEENEATGKEYRQREADLARTRAEVRKVDRVRDALLRKNRALEDHKVDAESERRTMKEQTEMATARIAELKAAIEVDKKLGDDQRRERDMLRDQLKRTDQELAKHTSVSLLLTTTRHNLEMEIQRCRAETADVARMIRAVEVERDGYARDAARVQGQTVATVQEIKDKEMEIFDHKRKTVQAETKLKHQQNLYETAQSDRNVHAKHLVEVQNRIAEMKKNLKVVNFRIGGLREDIVAKDACLAAERREKEKLTKDIETIDQEVKSLKTQTESSHVYLKQQISEESNLSHVVKEAEQQKSRQENALQTVVSDRDSLSAQLMQRDEDLAKVYDQLKTQRALLLRSEMHYRDKIRSLRVLREKLVETRKTQMEFSNEAARAEEMRNVVVRLDSELTREKAKMTALEEELKNPMNVHRWRKLEGTNPKTLELVQLVQSLQRKLITKTEENRSKEKAIRDKEVQYIKLKSILSKQNCTSNTKLVETLEQNVKEKHQQLRHVRAEVAMYVAQENEYKYQLEKVNDELKALCGKYFAHQRALNSQTVGGASVAMVPNKD
ncbi:hypothetical protein HDU93_009680 [Gonapodya sp. JEL0774]|nr:hypothetical protein HDU93_009680 [Gonapodya sp. JEL0774]